MFGFINIYKPKGKTSHDVVAILRRITKIKQIGHTGTLDPFAEGVLPVCIGKSTRLIEYLGDDKAYVATIQLGKSTTTYDTEGEFVNSSDKQVELSEIEKVLDLFRGEIEQVPPIYSAIKVNGKKLYEYARKGESIEIQSRKITINELRVLNYDFDSRQLELFINCSKGTYIRSLANDIGEALAVYGYLIKLVRVKAGDFYLENTIKLDDIKTKEDVFNHLENPLNYLNYPIYHLLEEEKNKVINGVSLNISHESGLILLIYNSMLAAVAEIADNKAVMRKVFL